MEFVEKKLEQIGTIITGKTPKTSIDEYYGDYMLFLTPSDNMDTKYITQTNKKLSKVGVESVKNILLPPNTICVSCIGSDLGKVVITKENTVTNQQINSIIVNKEYDVDYVYYCLKIIGKKLKYDSKNSTAVPIINKTTFSKELINVPSLKYQKVIGKILADIDSKIEFNLKINNNKLKLWT